MSDQAVIELIFSQIIESDNRDDKYHSHNDEHDSHL